MLVPDDEKVNDLLTITYPRCEVKKTLRGGYCELPGKVRLAGLLVCERHARQLEAQDRRALLEGIVGVPLVYRGPGSASGLFLPRRVLPANQRFFMVSDAGFEPAPPSL